MKTTGLKSNLKFISALTVLFFSFGILNQQKVLAGNPLSKKDSAKSTISATKPATKTAKTSTSQSGNLQDSTRSGSPLSHAPKPAATAKPASTEEGKRIENQRAVFVTALNEEIAGVNKLVATLYEEEGQIVNKDMIVSNRLSHATKIRVQKIKDSMNEIFASLPNGSMLPPNLYYLKDSFMATSQNLGAEIDQSLSEYQAHLSSRKSYLNNVFGVYKTYGSEMETYRNSVEGSAFPDAEAFYAKMGKKPVKGSEPEPPSLTPVDFPPSSYAAFIHDAKDLFKQIKDALTSMLNEAKTETNRLTAERKIKNNEFIKAQRTLNRAQKEYEIASRGVDGMKIQIAEAKLRLARINLNTAKEELSAAQGKLDQANSNQAKINFALKKAAQALTEVDSPIKFMYGLKNTQFIYAANEGSLKHENKFDPEQIGVVQNNAVKSYFKNLISMESSEIKRLQEEYNVFERFVGTQSGSKITRINAKVTQIAAKTIEDLTTLSSSLPSTLSFSDALKTLMTKAKSDSQNVLDTLLSQALQSYQQYLHDKLAGMKTVLTNHENHVQAVQNYIDGLILPHSDPFSLVARAPQGKVDPAEPAKVSFPPTSLISMMDSKPVFAGALESVQSFETKAMEEVERLKAELIWRKEVFESKKKEVTYAQAYLKKVTDGGGSESEKTEARDALAKAILARDAAQSSLNGVDLRYKRAQENVSRLGLTKKFLKGVISKMSRDITALITATL